MNPSTVSVPSRDDEAIKYFDVVVLQLGGLRVHLNSHHGHQFRGSWVMGVYAVLRAEFSDSPAVKLRPRLSFAAVDVTGDFDQEDVLGRVIKALRNLKPLPDPGIEVDVDRSTANRVVWDFAPDHQVSLAAMELALDLASSSGLIDGFELHGVVLDGGYGMLEMRVRKPRTRYQLNIGQVIQLVEWFIAQAIAKTTVSA